MLRDTARSLEERGDMYDGWMDRAGCAGYFGSYMQVARVASVRWVWGEADSETR